MQNINNELREIAEYLADAEKDLRLLLEDKKDALAKEDWEEVEILDSEINRTVTYINELNADKLHVMSNQH